MTTPIVSDTSFESIKERVLLLSKYLYPDEYTIDIPAYLLTNPRNQPQSVVLDLAYWVFYTTSWSVSGHNGDRFDEDKKQTPCLESDLVVVLEHLSEQALTKSQMEDAAVEAALKLQMDHIKLENKLNRLTPGTGVKV